MKKLVAVMFFIVFVLLTTQLDCGCGTSIHKTWVDGGADVDGGVAVSEIALKCGEEREVTICGGVDVAVSSACGGTSVKIVASNKSQNVVIAAVTNKATIDQDTNYGCMNLSEKWTVTDKKDYLSQTRVIVFNANTKVDALICHAFINDQTRKIPAGFVRCNEEVLIKLIE